MTHGIRVFEPVTGSRAIKPVATAVIGIIATATAAAGAATNALNAAFPLDTPVLVTDVRSAIGQAGTGGTLKPALEAIADQARPIIVVVRIAAGVDTAATNTAVIGTTTNQGIHTGMQALLSAETALGVRPRILGAPGLDTQPVATALAIVARRLRGMAYVSAIGADVAAAILYRANFAARELMLIWPDTSKGVAGDAIARALGLRARIDTETGWHKTLSNVAMDGVEGLSKSVSWDLLSSDNEAGLLNADEVTTIIRQNGFRFWGNRTCSDEPLFAFESAVRTSQALQDEIAYGLAWAVDKPITKGLLRDIEETINGRIRRLVADGRLIGGRAWIDPDNNPPGDLAAGQLVVDYDFTPCAPAEAITLNQRITDQYYAQLFALPTS